MQNQHTLTRNFSLQQAKHFLACWDRQNDLFRQSEKNYAAEKMRFETPSGVSPLSSMNGYVSENGVFFFCERMALVEKNGLMLLGNFMIQDH
jgi:hypothetical protein